MHGVDVGGPVARAALNEGDHGERGEGLTQFTRGVHDNVLEGNQGRRPGLSRPVARDLNLTDHLAGPVGALGHAGGGAIQHRPRGAFGVQGVGLAVLVTQLAIRAVHLEHAHPGATKELRKSDAVTAGALNTEGLDATVCLGPVV